jgi:thiamine pyrophosphate-dependent acetolactate synthase large subunit-like protein
VSSRVVDGPQQLGEGLNKALASDKPELVEVKVAPGMALT